MPTLFLEIPILNSRGIHSRPAADLNWGTTAFDVSVEVRERGGQWSDLFLFYVPRRFTAEFKISGPKQEVDAYVLALKYQLNRFYSMDYLTTLNRYIFCRGTSDVDVIFRHMVFLGDLKGWCLFEDPNEYAEEIADHAACYLSTHCVLDNRLSMSSRAVRRLELAVHRHWDIDNDVSNARFSAGGFREWKLADEETERIDLGNGYQMLRFGERDRWRYANKVLNYINEMRERAKRSQ